MLCLGLHLFTSLIMPYVLSQQKRITVRPEVTEFLTKGEIYCQVCNSIFHGKAPVVGQWAVLQTLSRHGFYVVEEGDIAVTDSALQQKKPFRKVPFVRLKNLTKEIIITGQLQSKELQIWQLSHKDHLLKYYVQVKMLFISFTVFQDIKKTL